MSETFMQRTGGLTVRTAGKADAERLIGLFNEAFRKAKDARTAHWKYFDSPHGVSTTLLAEGPRGGPAGAVGGRWICCWALPASTMAGAIPASASAGMRR